MKKKRQWEVKDECLSIILFSCLELQYLYVKDHYASHYEESDDDLDSWESVGVAQSVRMEEEEEEEEEEKRPWDALPSSALLNIFCKSQLKDRLKSIPLVCKSWKTVTDDPRCWASMIPDSVSPEDAFIRNTSGYICVSYPARYYRKSVKNDCKFLNGISRLFKEEGDDQVDEEEEEEVPVGLSRLRTLIKKSGGGAAITTLYLSPFLSWAVNSGESDSDEILPLIANSCPNLKHISLDALSHEASTEALLQLFKRCKKLELVDLSNSIRYDDANDDAPLVIQELGKCLPNLRGIRISTCEPDPVVVSITTYLPQLKLLSFGSTLLVGEHLSNILCCCRELQYLYVERTWELLSDAEDIIDRASAQIPEFYFDNITFTWYCNESDCANWDNDYVDMQECEHSFEDQYSMETDDFHIDDDFHINDDFHIDDYRNVLKLRKEDQYVPILKKKMKKKKKDQCNSSLIKKKKKYSTLNFF